MEVVICGAAGGEVTGSAYLIRTKSAQVLVDFGMFQGSSETEDLNIFPAVIDPKKLNAVVLTHAHLDHSGRLPLLVKQAYQGPIFATSASVMMAELILKDAAHLQMADAERRNRRSPGKPPVVPLYSFEEVEALAKLYSDLPYDQPIQIAPGISVRACESGHMLGSVSLQFNVEEDGQRKVLVFSGDLGPRGAPVLKDSVPFDHADVVFLESTYGDRDHPPLHETAIEAREIVRQAVEEKGKMLMPVFAVGRAQLMLYLLAGAFQRGTLPAFPVFLDSPMAIKATNIYKQNVELFDAEALEMYQSGELSANLQTASTCETAAESMALNDVRGPCLIMAGSGMCNGGRILHHLKHNLSKPSTKVLIVGYQSHGSLGRRLVDKTKTVKIFGEEIPVRASVHSLGGFSAHAGQTDLLYWLKPLAASKPKVFLTHGEDRGRKPLGQKIQSDFGLSVQYPALDETIVI